MSIEKKSLISTLKTTKKANVASAPASHDGVVRSEIVKKGLVKKGLVKKGLVKKGLVKKGLVKKGLVKMEGHSAS
jgi:hypothetical protein